LGAGAAAAGAGRPGGVSAGGRVAEPDLTPWRCPAL